jgi:hypothetical protein
MENINRFLLHAEKVGCPKMELFQTVDLYEEKNPIQVLEAIYSLSRNAAKKYPELPLLGPKLAEKQTIKFTEEQLKAERLKQVGSNNPFLSYGGGANASGIQFGGRRDIGGVDPNKVDNTPKN